MCFQPALNKTQCLTPPPTHLLTIRALQATKLGFLSRPLPSPPLPTELGFLNLLLLPLIGSQQNDPMVAYSAPTEFPHLQQIHTQTLGKDHKPSSTVYQHTPAPLFPHSQLPPFCKSIAATRQSHGNKVE